DLIVTGVQTCALPIFAVPPRLLLRSVRLGLFAVPDRVADVAELLQPAILDQRSGLLPAALRARGLCVGALLGRRVAGRHVERRSGRLHPRLLLVASAGSFIEGASLAAAPLLILGAIDSAG